MFLILLSRLSSCEGDEEGKDEEMEDEAVLGPADSSRDAFLQVGGELFTISRKC